jgi:hypothetical protein
MQKSMVASQINALRKEKKKNRVFLQTAHVFSSSHLTGWSFSQE